MLTGLAFVLAAAAQAATPAPPAAPAAHVPAAFVSPADIARMLENGIVKSAVDQPMQSVDVHGGRAVVAMLHRDRAEAGALIHERAPRPTTSCTAAARSSPAGRSARPSPPT